MAQAGNLSDAEISFSGINTSAVTDLAVARARGLILIFWNAIFRNALGAFVAHARF